MCLCAVEPAPTCPFTGWDRYTFDLNCKLQGALFVSLSVDDAQRRAVNPYHCWFPVLMMIDQILFIPVNVTGKVNGLSR